MREVAVCPSCGGSDLGVLHKLTIQDVYDSPETKLGRTNNYQRNYLLFRRILEPGVGNLDVTFLFCRSCSFIFFTPRPDDSDLETKYSGIRATCETYRREKVSELVDLRCRRAREIHRRVAPFVRGPIKRALDVGGADGHCLAGLTNKTECVVLDFEERDLWPGVKRAGRSLADLGGGERFDLVLCCHTLEHIDRVSEFVAEMRRHVGQQGILYVEVPLGCCGEVYRTRNVLTHLNFFSKASLTSLLQRNGFSVEHSDVGPVLSRKRYLGVVTAVARESSQELVSNSATGVSYDPACLQMGCRSVARRVLLWNVMLVLSQPIRYLGAIVRRYRKLHTRFE